MTYFEAGKACVPVEYRYISEQPNYLNFLRGLDYKIQLGFKLESFKIRYFIFECTKMLCKKIIDTQISDPSYH